MDIYAHRRPTDAETSATVGRFAPTPSGRMHLGNVASCLVAWLSARASGGRVVMRIEDLDPRGNNPEAARLIMDDLLWLGLYWDGEPKYQSKRIELYEAALERLGDGDAESKSCIASNSSGGMSPSSGIERGGLGLTYPCFCTRGELHAASAPHASDGTYIYSGACRNLSEQEIAKRSAVRPPATRLRVPATDDCAGNISFTDLTYGKLQETLASECGDFLVRRSDGVIAYQLAVVVDDAEMGVTEVVRGRDLLGSTARQIYLQHLLDLPEPSYGHIPLLVAPDGRRLSKRNRDLDLSVLRERYSDPALLLSAIASRLGLCEPGENLHAEALAERFSWNVISAHRKDIVVDKSFLP